jgi:proteasome lid subunit RPN8/RPN11
MQGFISRLLERLRRLFARSRALVVVDDALWDELLQELAARGGGVRESGAFLLGPPPVDSSPRRALAAAYYDDLDPTSLTGGISFSGSAYGRLWDVCDERSLAVVADVHTHPGRYVAQSSTDRAHPMLAERGHIALIVPNFAQGRVAAADVGVHEYLGDGAWRSTLGARAAGALRIDRMA